MNCRGPRCGVLWLWRRLKMSWLTYLLTWLPVWWLSKTSNNCTVTRTFRTRSSATAEELRDALRQLKYYGRFCEWAIDKKAEEHASTLQLKSCKMVHKCSTDCIWKRLQAINNLQGHSRSLPLLPFDRPYAISSSVSVCQSCTFFEILTLICQKLRRHVTLTTPTRVCHHH